MRQTTLERLKRLEEGLHALSIRNQNVITLGTIAEIDYARGRATVHCGNTLLDVSLGTLLACEDRLWAPPSVGAQVVVAAQSGQLETAVALCHAWRERFPALGTDDEIGLWCGDGTVIKYKKSDRQVNIDVGSGSVKVQAKGGVTFIGDVTVLGNLIAFNKTCG